MTDLAEAILRALLERGPLTWYRLDPILSAQGFMMGPQLSHEIGQLVKRGLLIETPAPRGPALLKLSPAGQIEAQYFAAQAAEHQACITGRPVWPRASELWEQLALQATLRDRADPGLGPREAAT